LRDAALSHRARLRQAARARIRDLVQLGCRREELAGMTLVQLDRLKAAMLVELMKAPKGAKGRP
jgi:hypothetical protein